MNFSSAEIAQLVKIMEPTVLFRISVVLLSYISVHCLFYVLMIVCYICLLPFVSE